ncbi:hypothetical protein Tco_1124956 [Tanacetum coccineum]|uniref:ATPase AAA-type core domain-containing protein n=1 Tax=Tanacetum coccineum TaxID=301880 RepID=A0ABQ5J8R8_9ASTR
MSEHRVVDVHYAYHISTYTRSGTALKEERYDVYDRFDRMSERKGSGLREHLECREVLVDQKIHWKSKEPCVVFIDELGAFGKQRGTGDSRVPNNVLGSSLLRPGWFGRYSSVERIDITGRSCLENYMVGVHNMERFCEALRIKSELKDQNEISSRSQGNDGYVRLPTVMMKLLSDNGNQDFGDFKATILGMLGTSLIEDDTYYMMKLLKIKEELLMGMAREIFFVVYVIVSLP